MNCSVAFVLTVFTLGLSCQSSYGQPSHVLLDTIYPIVTDSFSHNVSAISKEMSRVSKSFMYIGKEPAHITKTWTNDPHFICEYPSSEVLTPDSIYQFTVCFSTVNREGPFRTSMGFQLSTGERVNFTFSGQIQKD